MTGATNDSPASSAARRGWVVFTMCFGVVLTISSMSSLYPAIPELAADIGASQKELTWIVDSYTLVFACLLLPAGAIGDRYGRRRALIVGLALFSVTTALTVAGDSPEWIIACRALSGVGAAFIMPSTLSLITTVYRAEDRGRTVGIWSAAAVLGALVGLVYGGALIEAFRWPSIFWLAVAGAVLLLVLAPTVPASKDPGQPPLDVPGAVLAAAAVAVLVYGLIEAPEQGWTSLLVLGCLAGSVLLAALFVVTELRTRHPLLDIRLLGNRAFGSGALVVTGQFAAGFGFYFAIVQFLQYVEGLSPIMAGFVLAPCALTIIPLSIVAPALGRRFGLKLVAGTGMFISAVSYGLYCFIDADTGVGLYLTALLLMGIGWGTTMSCGTAAIVDNVPDSKQGVASAVNDDSREVGAAIGLAFLGSLLASGYRGSIEQHTSALPGPARDAANESIAGALTIAEAAGPNGAPLATAAKEAFTTGMHHAMLGAAVLMFAVTLVLFWWAPGRPAATAAHRADRVTADRV